MKKSKLTPATQESCNELNEITTDVWALNLRISNFIDRNRHLTPEPERVKGDVEESTKSLVHALEAMRTDLLLTEAKQKITELDGGE